ncbi:MAG: glycosyltransferase, partial [Candidatus Eisenbacteria bacterium]|nr:glycosyltransferase [Candidatus Eisenbacteria bacterium]
PRRDRATWSGIADASLPVVTVQLPVYNEGRVIERLIDAVAALEAPVGGLEIQVLDDSTDETRELAARAVERHRARGVDIRHLRRESRHGFKAGALAWGLERARGELIAVFDADFVPPPDFLRRMIPHFDDPRVGMAQARWTHLNRGQSRLTAAQAVMLDSHFLLEHEVRERTGLFFNFNGTAGIWRRSCIERAGGWAHDTLTEDLDLSYRAQLAGWKFVFDPTVEAPAELPADMEAFKSQQRRWAKGSIQTARKVLPALIASALPRRVKVEAVVHLTSNVTYPLLLALGLLLLPMLLGTSTLPPAVVWVLQGGVIVLGVVPVGLFLAFGQRAARSRGLASVIDVAWALVLGTGLALNNARAVFEGLGSSIGDWERTPKSGDPDATCAPDATRASDARRDLDAARLPARYLSATRFAGRAELALGVYFAGLGAFVWDQQLWRALPFVMLLSAGFAYVGWGSLRASTPRARAG